MWIVVHSWMDLEISKGAGLGTDFFCVKVLTDVAFVYVMVSALVGIEFRSMGFSFVDLKRVDSSMSFEWDSLVDDALTFSLSLSLIMVSLFSSSQVVLLPLQGPFGRDLGEVGVLSGTVWLFSMAEPSFLWKTRALDIILPVLSSLSLEVTILSSRQLLLWQPCFIDPLLGELSLDSLLCLLDVLFMVGTLLDNVFEFKDEALVVILDDESDAISSLCFPFVRMGRGYPLASHCFLLCHHCLTPDEGRDFSEEWSFLSTYPCSQGSCFTMIWSSAYTMFLLGSCMCEFVSCMNQFCCSTTRGSGCCLTSFFSSVLHRIICNFCIKKNIPQDEQCDTCWYHFLLISDEFLFCLWKYIGRRV
jgi:hypothetical protein